MKILANDGISANGVEELEAAGFEVSTVTVALEQLEITSIIHLGSETCEMETKL